MGLLFNSIGQGQSVLNRGFTGLIKQIGTIFLHAEIAEAELRKIISLHC